MSTTTTKFLCLYCRAAKEHPKPASVWPREDDKRCILCYVEEDVSICRKCSVPWLASYDSNNAYRHDLQFASVECTLLCLECVRTRKQLTLPKDVIDQEQLKKVKKVVAKRGGPPPVEVIASEVLRFPVQLMLEPHPEP